MENSNDEINFPPKLLLTDTQVSRLCKSFTKVSLDEIINTADVFRKIMPGLNKQ